MKIGYNTNGLGCHRWEDTLRWLAEIGYQSVAITVDHYWLDPYSENLSTQLPEIKRTLDQLGMTSMIETGARFLLSPQQKHEPTLMSATATERAIRIDFLKRAVDIAFDIKAEAVSFWSGILREPITDEDAMQRLVEGCREVACYATSKNVQLAFEPEPGMFIETMEQYRQLKAQIDESCFGLTIDIGHLQCVEEKPISTYLQEWKSDIYNIHIEDMKQGVHEHLRFGDGEIDFADVFEALKEIQYAGPVNVELSRHSHMADIVVPESWAFLQGYL